MNISFRCSYLLLLLATVATVKSSCIINPEIEMCCNDVRNDIPCGHSRYDYTCCGDKIVLEVDYLNICCKNEIIDNSTTVCINRSATEIPDDAKSNDQLSAYTDKDTGEISFYDQNKQICCNGKLQDRNYESSGCCGDEEYDEEQNLCCGFPETNIVPVEGKATDFMCCGDNAYYNPRTQECCNNSAVYDYMKFHECCGPELYNKAEKICCNDKIVDVVDVLSFDSCGDEAFNTYTNKCCGTTIIDIDLGCCNGMPYDLTTQYCCEGVHPEMSYQYQYYVVPLNGLDGSSATLECCGDQVYCKKEKSCNNGILAETPGYTIFSMCGTETIYGYPEECCNGKPYNARTHICYGDVVKAMDYNFQSTCTINTTYSIVDNRKQFCCFNEIVDKTPEDKAAGRYMCSYNYNN